MIRRFARGSLAGPVLALALFAPALVLGSDGSAPPAVSSAGNGCQGIANAYAHVSANVARNGNNGSALTALANVAAKLGCDLTVPPPASAGQHPDTDKTASGDATNEDDSATPDNKPDKCAQIALKLATAQARPHGKSADAFARQAEHWGCPAN